MKPQLHVSMLDMLSRCGEQFRRRYGSRFGWNDKEEIIPPSVAIVTGIATHKSIERNLSEKIATGTYLPVEAVKDFARDQVTGLWTQEVFLSDEERENQKEVKGESINTAIVLSELHASTIAPVIEPKASERKWVVEMEGYPYDLAGTIDIETTDGAVRDTKTSGKTPAITAADDSNQLTMYSLAKKVCDGEAPTNLYLDYLVKTKTPKVVTFSTTRTPADHEMILRRIERATEIIEKGAFIPANPTDWWCSKKFCGYHATCPFAKR